MQSRLQASSQRYQTLVLSPDDPEAQMVIQHFMASQPSGYGIKKITCVYNRILQMGFLAHLINIEEEAKKFQPGWSQEPLSDQRKEVIANWKALASSFSPLHVNIDQAVEVLAACQNPSSLAWDLFAQIDIDL